MDAWNYFILRCLAIGIPPKQIAILVGCQFGTMHSYLWKLRKRYHARTSWEIVPNLLEDSR